MRLQSPAHVPPPNNPMSASAFHPTSNGQMIPPQIPRHPPNLMGGGGLPPSSSVNSNSNNNPSGLPHNNKSSGNSISATVPNNTPNQNPFPQGHSFNGRSGPPQQPLPPLPQMGPPSSSNSNNNSSNHMGPLIGANSTSMSNGGGPVPAPRGMNPSSITNSALPSIPGGNKTASSGSVSGGSSSLSPPLCPPNAPNSICSSSNSNTSGSGGRPRPQPISGTPPPETTEKCDAKLVQQTCTLFGLDMVSV
jgi:hypothetical protein